MITIIAAIIITASLTLFATIGMVEQIERNHDRELAQRAAAHRAMEPVGWANLPAPTYDDVKHLL